VGGGEICKGVGLKGKRREWSEKRGGGGERGG